MRVRNVLIAANVLLIGSLAAQLMVVSGGQERTRIMGSWKDRPQSLAATTTLAQEVVHGRVRQVRRAAPLVIDAPGEPGDRIEIPIEVITIELVDNAAKGKRRTGETVELFHTGHSDEESPAERAEPKEKPPARPADAVDRSKAQQSREKHMAVVMTSLMEDPGYRQGEEYVLFTRQGPTVQVGGQNIQTQGIVSPEGRYRIRDEKVEPMSGRTFAQQLRGRSAKELKDRAAKGGKG